MKKITLAIAAAAIGIALAPSAGAMPSHEGPQDDVTCSSNMAYRTAHPDLCKTIGVNSHGGGGGADSDGDGVKDPKDPADHDPNIPNGNTEG